MEDQLLEGLSCLDTFVCKGMVEEFISPYTPEN